MMFWVNQDQNNLRGLVNRHASNSTTVLYLGDRPAGQKQILTVTTLRLVKA